MAVSQQRSDKLLAALDNAIPRHRYKTTIGIKTKGRGFTRPTNASKLKQVATRTPKKMLLNGAKGESIAMLKNLAKLLVGRIEAACAARKTPQPISEVPNPKRNLNTAPPSGLLQGPNPEKDAGQEVDNAHEHGSTNVDADESSCDYTEEAHLPPLDTLELGGNGICQFIQESDRIVDDASRGTPNLGGSSICETSDSCGPKDSRPSSRPDHCSDSIWDTSDCYKPEDSRPSSRPNDGISSIWENSESCRLAESRPSTGTNYGSSSVWETSESCRPKDSRPRSRTDHGIQCDWETSESCRPRVPRPSSQPNHGSRSNWERSESCRQADSRPSSRPNHGGSSVWETSESRRPKNSRPSSQPNHGNSSNWETSGSCTQADSRPSSRPNHGGSSVWETSESCRPKNSRPSSQPNPSGSTSETFEGPDSRPCSRTHREWTETPVRKVASLSSRVINLKKVNVGLDDCEIESSKAGLHSTPGRKRRSPGLRSLVVSQVVKNLPAPPARSPANTKLVLSSSKSVRKAAEEMKYKVDSVQKGERDEELYEAALADVVQNMFDEVFGDQEQELINRKRQAPSHQVSSPRHGSEEWLYQRQSIEYSYSTDGAARKGVHCRANVDQRYRTTAPPTSRELSDTKPRRRSLREEASDKAPLILPTFAKYHLDKIERYKKCVAEKQVRDALRFPQECSRPSTAPDPYNVLNVFTERCAPQRHVKTAAHDGDGGRELFTNQPRSIPAPTTIMDDRCRASKARQYQPEMDELHDESVDTRGATNLRPKQSRIESEERHSDSKNRTCMEKRFLHGGGDDQRSRNDSQATIPAVSKKRFVEYWPFLDRQIEGFIQAHILQCCILFKNIPPVFPTLEYQEEIQRLHSAHPLSTR